MNNVFERLVEQSISRPQEIAFTDDLETITYRDLACRVYGLASRLTDAPKTIGIALSNSIDWIVADLAIALSGRCMVPLPLFFSQMQLTHIIEDSLIGLLLTNRSTPENIIELKQPFIKIDQSMGETPILYAGGAERIIYTSGSTGTPKGVRLGDRQINHIVDALQDATHASDQDLHLSTLPFSLLLEQICGIYLPITAGAKCHIAGHATQSALQGDPAPLASIAAKVKPTTTVLVPQILDMWRQFLNAAGNNAPDSLRFVAVGGAAITGSSLRLAENTGFPVHQGYGLSECASVVCLNRIGKNKLGTVGLPLKGIQLSIDNGEIVISSPTVMSGYTNKPLAQEKWHTGDLGYVNEDGTVVIVGRRDNQITISSGRNISPETVENIIATLPMVKAVALAPNAANNLAMLVIPEAENFAIFNAMSYENLKTYFQEVLTDLPVYMHPEDVLVCPLEDAIISGILKPTGIIDRLKCSGFVQAKAFQL